MGGCSSPRSPDGDTLTYLWDFGDGSEETQTTTPITSHVYATSGTFTASLTVRDARGATSEQAATVRIDAGNAAPVPTIHSPSTSLRFHVGQTLELTGSATDPEDGTLFDSQLTWEALLHHDSPPPAADSHHRQQPHAHRSGAGGPGRHHHQLRRDTPHRHGLAGRSTTVVRNVLPNIVDVTLDSVPSGLSLGVNGSTVTTPATLEPWEGYTLNVTAPAQADSTGAWKVWASWSDGGAQAHGYVTPATTSSLTATYKAGLRARVNFQPLGSPVPRLRRRHGPRLRRLQQQGLLHGRGAAGVSTCQPASMAPAHGGGPGT